MKGTGKTGRSLLSLSNRWPCFCGIFLNFAWAEFLLCQAFTIKFHQWSKRNYSRTIVCKTVLNDMLLGKRRSQRIPDYGGISAFRREQIRSLMIQQRKWCWKVIVKYVLFLGGTKHVCMAMWSKGLKCKKNNTLQQVQGGLFNQVNDSMNSSQTSNVQICWILLNCWHKDVSMSHRDFRPWRANNNFSYMLKNY